MGATHINDGDIEEDEYYTGTLITKKVYTWIQDIMVNKYDEARASIKKDREIILNSIADEAAKEQIKLKREA